MGIRKILKRLPCLRAVEVTNEDSVAASAERQPSGGEVPAGLLRFAVEVGQALPAAAPGAALHRVAIRRRAPAPVERAQVHLHRDAVDLDGPLDDGGPRQGNVASIELRALALALLARSMAALVRGTWPFCHTWPSMNRLVAMASPVSAVASRVVVTSPGRAAIRTWLTTAPPFCASPVWSSTEHPFDSRWAAIPSSAPMVMTPVPPTPVTMIMLVVEDFNGWTCSIEREQGR